MEDQNANQQPAPQPEKPKKKRNGWKIALIIILAVIVLIGIVSCGACSTAANKLANDAKNIAGEPAAQTEQPAYEITGEYLDTSNPYSSYIRGTFVNTSGVELSYVEIDYRLLDAAGNQIDSAFTNTTNVAAGGTWVFDVIARTDTVAFERVDVDMRKKL